MHPMVLAINVSNHIPGKYFLIQESWNSNGYFQYGSSLSTTEVNTGSIKTLQTQDIGLGLVKLLDQAMKEIS
jgi:hypothetical protein